jgi:hypothetical protein
LGEEGVEGEEREEERAFWKQVETLWAERQDLLLQAYENMLKPAEELGRLIGVLKEGGEEEVVRALMELEDWLSDVDMAQDFYTLGGWPLLVSKLGREGGREGGREVQWRAAWVVGNAVKNDRRFQEWVLEGGKEGGASALTRLLTICREGGTEAGGEGEDEEELLRKAVYAVTSAARGNPAVQAKLVEEGGLEVLGHLLHSSVPPSPGFSHQRKGQRRALCLKLIAFAQDLALEAKQAVAAALEVAEARHPPSVPPSLPPSLLAGVTSPAWCEGNLGLLEEVVEGEGGRGARALEGVLEAMQLLHVDCVRQGRWEEGGREVERLLRRAREVVDEEDWKEGVDREYWEDLVNLIEALLEETREGGRAGGRGEL